MKKLLKNLRKIASASIPTFGEISSFVKISFVFFLCIILGYTFMVKTSVQAQSTTDVTSISAGAWSFITQTVTSCATPTFASSVSARWSAAANTTGGQPSDIQALCGEQFKAYTDNSTSGIIPIDYGATGQVINMGNYAYSEEITVPGTTMDYYASKIKGTANAQENYLSGRTALGPVFFLNQTMVNLAYGVIVIILIFSSLSILLSTLTGQESKVTVFQLILNAGITIVLLSLFYEIAAIIYDVSVNYGNALVASVMSPYINANVILDRLSPGGDLGIVAVLNTFQFSGVSDSLTTVVRNITAGLYPALSQSAIAFGRAATGAGLDNPIFAQGTAIFGGIAGSSASFGISGVLSSFLGSKEIFDAIISWTIFVINFKIFINLLSAFVTFTLYVGFGPLMLLNGITGGWEKMQDAFKVLLSYGLVFPMTLLFILFGAASMNIYTRGNNNVWGDDNSKTVLCAYSPKDPSNASRGIVDKTGIEEGLHMILGGDPTVEDPRQFYVRNYINQNIFDSKPAKTYFENGRTVRDCRSALFPTPWVYIPAPFGTIGPRQLQIQTIDSIIRSFLGIVFLIMATRVPAILQEVLDVKEMGALKGIEKGFSYGFKTFSTVGSTAVGIGLPIAMGGAMTALGGLANRINLSGPQTLGGMFGGYNGKGMRSVGQALSTARASGKAFTISDAFNTAMLAPQMTDSEAIDKKKELNSLYTGWGMNSVDAEKKAYDGVIKAFEESSKAVSSFGEIVNSTVKSLQEMSKALVDATKSFQQIINFSLIDEV